MMRAIRLEYGLLLLGALCFFPFLGGVHLFDWDEINFAECAREMLVSGDYLRVQIGFRPFYEKPPLFFWLQAASMRLFGINEFAARFPNAVAGLLTLAFLMYAGRAVHHRRFGWWWALCWLGALLPHLYAKSGIIDPWFNLFIFSGQFFLLRSLSRFVSLPLKAAGGSGELLLGGALLGLAILTKGPVAWLVSALAFGLFALWVGFRCWPALWTRFAVWSVVAAIVPALWFGIEMVKNGPEFFVEFMAYQYRLFRTPDAGHGGFFGYHFVVLLLGCFPASIFALGAFRQATFEAGVRNWWRWMVALLAVVLVLFSIVQSKIVHYSSLAYFPLTYLAALSIAGRAEKTAQWKRWQSVLLWAIGLLFALAVVAAPLLAQHPEWLKSWMAKDPFAQANLDAQVQWSVLESVCTALVLLAGLVWFAERRKRDWKGASAGLLLAGALFANLAIVVHVKRIEGYSQRAAIEFYESLQGRDVSVTTAGFKSYAHLFYARVRPETSVQGVPLDTLMLRPLPRPLYVVTKIHRLPELLARHASRLEEVGRKNGFVFLRKREGEPRADE